MSDLDIIENEDGDRFVLGTHDPQAALAALNRDAAEADRLFPPVLLCEDETGEFQYRWYQRVEPAHPDYECEYAAAEATDPHVVPGIRLPA